MKNNNQQKNIESLNKDFLIAVSEADFSKIKDLVKQGADINAKVRDMNAMTLIFSSSAFDRKAYEQIVNYLIEKGADLNTLDGMQFSWLHHAVNRDFMSTVKLIVEKKGLTDNIRSSNKRNPLIFFATSPQMVDYLIAHSLASLEDRDEFGRTVLHASCDMVIRPKMVEYFSKKIPIDIRDRKGKTPLLTAVSERYSSDDRKQVINFLIANGANVTLRDDANRTALMFAAQNDGLDSDMLQKLIKLGVNPNDRNKAGNQAIHYASACNPDHLKILHTMGADLNSKNDDNVTPLIVASQNNMKHIVEYLLNNNVDPNIVDSDGKTALNYAIENDFSDIVAMLQAHGAKASAAEKIAEAKCANETLAKQKAEKAKKEKPETILTAIQQKNMEKINSFFKAMKNPDMGKLLFESVRYGNMAVFRYFISKGADIHAKDKEGYSLLHDAVFYNQPDMTEFLINKGLDINANSDNGTSVFLLSANSSPEVIDLLMKAGIGTKQDEDKIVSDALERFRPDLARYFMDLGFKWDKSLLTDGKYIRSVIEEENVETLSFLLKQGLDIETELEAAFYKHTLLQHAVEFNATKSALFLIESGAKVDVRNNFGDRLYESAINNHNIEIIKAIFNNGCDINGDKTSKQTYWIKTPLDTALKLRRIDIAELLIQMGADVNKEGGSPACYPIHYTAEWGNLNLVKLIIERGADITAKNNRNQTALDVAQENDQKVVADYLRVLTKTTAEAKAKK